MNSLSFVDQHSSPEEKIALFRFLFRGRTDVYPRRFESVRTGRSGYQPACANEWVRGVCEKPRVKCHNCRARAFLAFNDEVVRWHLTGKDAEGKQCVVGIYPMLMDETCYFLAVDFDKGEWELDAAAYIETCRLLGVPAVLERSRSGKGGHVWIFFAESIPATMARKLGSYLITETMDRRPDIGFDSYDRLFPNQDTLPSGGFGNLIALPLQQAARMAGNSVFLDHEMNPYIDQWEAMSRIEKVSSERLEKWVREGEQKGRVVGVRCVAFDDDEEVDKKPWLASPSRRIKGVPITGAMPKRLLVRLSDQIYLAKSDLPPVLRNQIIRLAAFQNPEFYKAQSMRLSTYGKPRIITCAENHAEHVSLPRGCFEEMSQLFKSHKIKMKVEDLREGGTSLPYSFVGTLRDEQAKAGAVMLEHDTGVLAATTAFGKTVMAAWMIAERGVNTLILVHRKQLMEQWVERLGQFLGVGKKEIGKLGGGYKKLNGRLDIALIQSLVRKGEVDDRIADYGHVIIDECHHLSARSFELAVSRAKAKFILGLSATVTRKDGHHPIIFMQCGPVRYRVNAKSQAALRPFQHHVIVRSTGFRSMQEEEEDARMEFQRLYGELVNSEKRNALIQADVLEVIKSGRTPLIITERKEHLDVIECLLQEADATLVRLQGGMGKLAQREAMDVLKESESNERSLILLATGKLIGEGFDDSRFDTLFLTLPVSWKGTVAQYVGRLHRVYEGKRDVHVYDYADLEVPMLSRMFDRRCAGYEEVGYTILLPASALPGWPASVPLTINPEWKRTYAASIQRLITDGVDVRLAQLFCESVAGSCPNQRELEGNEGVSRSASERFFYERLQSLPETKNRFRMNVELAIPFNQRSGMEVDFLDEAIRLVIEMDGGQHLSDEEAYRSDRRKDALLQEHGYFVLRFLATDLAVRLDRVLDQVIRTMDHLKSKGEDGFC